MNTLSLIDGGPLDLLVYVVVLLILVLIVLKVLGKF
jgi:hypothetical protein